MRVPRRTAIFIALLWPWACLPQHSSKSPPSVEYTTDLRPFGFPDEPNPTVVANVKCKVFFLSNEIVGLYFEERTPNPAAQSHRYKFLTFSKDGENVGQRPFRVDGDLLDVSSGPNQSILLREGERLDFFDVEFRLIKTHPLPNTATEIKCDRILNQIVVITADADSGNQNATFLRVDNLEESAKLQFPKHARAIFGEKQLGYTLPGWCKGALHVEPDNVSWQSLAGLETCDTLTFVSNEALAFATGQDLYIVHKTGKVIFHSDIPAPDSFHMPDFVGLSDDRSRLAIMANMKHSIFTLKPGVWPYYNEIFVYDLKAKKVTFKHELVEGYAAAFSPDGHRLATIESGKLKILSVP